MSSSRCRAPGSTSPTMADLDDVCTAFHARHHRRLRVATKYLQLTRAFFAAHGIADYRIVESLGATEGAPAAGLAEAIVDITTTGATLAANDLKILDDGRYPEKSGAARGVAAARRGPRPALEAADRLTARIAARELAAKLLSAARRAPAFGRKDRAGAEAGLRLFGASAKRRGASCCCVRAAAFRRRSVFCAARASTPPSRPSARTTSSPRSTSSGSRLRQALKRVDSVNCVGRSIAERRSCSG